MRNVIQRYLVKVPNFIITHLQSCNMARLALLKVKLRVIDTYKYATDHFAAKIPRIAEVPPRRPALCWLCFDLQPCVTQDWDCE